MNPSKSVASPLSLLIVPLLIVCCCSPVTSARRNQKVGCLNYGHSCLGAHGKRASWNSDVQLPAPSASQPSATLSRPLLSILLEALNAHPEILASLQWPRDSKALQPSDAHLQDIRYNSRRLGLSHNNPEKEDSSSRPLMPETLVGLMGNRLSGGDLINDRVTEEDDALYVVNGEDYADESIRRSTVEKAPISTESKNDLQWEKDNTKNHRLEKLDNSDVRLFANWFRR